MHGWCCSWLPRNGSAIPRPSSPAETAGELSWDEAVARAEASGLVTFASRVEFRHPLVRSAVYYSASEADRRRAHAALAGVLDTDTDADRRAWHLGAAAAGPDERVAQALEASAERARRRGGAARGGVSVPRLRAHARSGTSIRAPPGGGSGRLLAGHGPQARELLERARAEDSAPTMTPTRHGQRRWSTSLPATSGNLQRSWPERSRGSESVTPSWPWGPVSPPTPSCSPADTSSTSPRDA